MRLKIKLVCACCLAVLFSSFVLCVHLCAVYLVNFCTSITICCHSCKEQLKPIAWSVINNKSNYIAKYFPYTKRL